MDGEDEVCENSSHLIVELTELMEVAKVEAFSEQENGEQMVEVCSRKLTEKGRYYQTEIKVKSFKSKRSLRNTLLLREQCNELSTWK